MTTTPYWGPIRLGPNQPPQFYAGGASIAALRGDGSRAVRAPEDWVASTTTLFGQDSAGLTRLDGTTLRERIREHPEDFLGADHVTAYGDDPALLVKLLDAGQRLPVHVHPDREFANRHLGSPHGKTEAWYVVATTGADPAVHLGLREPADPETIRGWVDRQDGEAMLAAMHELPVRPGDAVLVPAGTPHAIGAGVFLVELQEPTDFSVMLERAAFGIEGGDLGLGSLALDCLDGTSWDDRRIAAVRAHPAARPGERVRVMPPAADPFFRAELLRAGDDAEVELDPAYAVVIVLDGDGTVTTDAGELAVSRGDTLLVPHAAGAARITGDLTAIRCLPPAPESR